MANIVIDVAAEFTGKKAFDNANKSTVGLEKSVKKLGKAFVGVFAAQKILAFGKASVKAFAEDDAAAKSLGQTLKNLGLAYGANVGTVNGFINRLEAQTGVLDDELRPALDRILRATGDVAESQKLLALALDIAAGTGKSVTQVSQSLQKAYLGQTQALGRLGVGLSKAELASSDFEQIQARLADLFAGQATRAANSYQGSLNKLQVAANNAKETIGKGLVDALGILSNSQNVDGTVSAIDKISNAMANGIKETATFIKVMQTLFSDLSFFSNKNTVAEALRIKMGTGFTTPMTISSQDTQRADKLAADAAKKAAAAKIKAEKAAAAAKIAADKKAAANAAKLAKAQSVFDLQKIQIAAALKGKISEEEKTRLLLMQAIADEDTVKAEALQKKLEEIQKQNAKIAADLLAIGQAKDPFATWAGSLALAVAQLSKLNSGITMIPGVTYNPAQSKDRNYDDALAAAAAAKAAADKAAAEKAAAEAAAILGGASEKAAAEKAAADAAAAKLAKDAADKAAAAALGGAGITFNEKQNPDRNYDTKAAADAAAAAAVAVTNGSPVAGTNFNPSQSRDRNYDSGYMMQAPVTVNVTVTGSVIAEQDLVKTVNDAIVTGNTQGLRFTRPGSLQEFE
jgi:hypothetical protein